MKMDLIPEQLITDMIVCHLQAQNDEFAAIFNLEDYKGGDFIIRLFTRFIWVVCFEGNYS